MQAHHISEPTEMSTFFFCFFSFSVCHEIKAAHGMKCVCIAADSTTRNCLCVKMLIHFVHLKRRKKKKVRHALTWLDATPQRRRCRSWWSGIRWYNASLALPIDMILTQLLNILCGRTNRDEVAENCLSRQSESNFFFFFGNATRTLHRVIRWK